MVGDSEARIYQDQGEIDDTILAVVVLEDITVGRDLVDVYGSEEHFCWRIGLDGRRPVDEGLECCCQIGRVSGAVIPLVTSPIG